MSAGFTPGPWDYLPNDESHAVVSPPVDAGDSIGPWFTAIVQCANDDVEEANARLIAAAPELYEACEAAEFLLAALCVERDSDTRVKLRSAIAKVGATHVDA